MKQGKIETNDVDSVSQAIYYFIGISNDNITISDIQEKFPSRSKSTLQEHLNELYELDLIKKNDKDEYFIEDDIEYFDILKIHMELLNKRMGYSQIFIGIAISGIIISFLFYSWSISGLIWLIIMSFLFSVLAISLFYDGWRMTTSLRKKI